MGQSSEEYIEMASREILSIPAIFTSVAPTKKQIEEGAAHIIKAIIEDGEIDPLRVATIMKAIETAMKIIKDGIEEAIVDEAEKEGVKTFERNGHQYQIRSSASRYDYTQCNDPEWSRLDLLFTEINGKKKEREKFLQGVSSEITISDESTGEIVTIYPPSKSNKNIVAITLAK